MQIPFNPKPAFMSSNMCRLHIERVIGVLNNA